MSKEKTAADHGNTLTAKEITKKTPQLDSVKQPSVDPVKRFADKIHEKFDPIEQSIAKLETRQKELNKQIADTEGTYDVKEIHERTVAKSELGEVNTALENAQAEYEQIKEDNAERLDKVYRESLAEMTAPLEAEADKQEAEINKLKAQVKVREDAARHDYYSGYRAITPKLFRPFLNYFPDGTIREPDPKFRFENGPQYSFEPLPKPLGPVDPWGKPLNQ